MKTFRQVAGDAFKEDPFQDNIRLRPQGLGDAIHSTSGELLVVHENNGEAWVPCFWQNDSNQFLSCYVRRSAKDYWIK